MMEWALAILFGAAVLLLIISFLKTWKTSTKIEQQMDQLSFSFLDEVNKLQEQIRTIELDGEITSHEAGVLASTSTHRILLRDMLDLHRRGYSLDTIAIKKQLSKIEVEQLLAPYIHVRAERSMVANDS